MKEIKNWEPIIKDENGNDGIAILLPGCIIKGEIDLEQVEIKVIDIDVSNLIVTDTNQEKYLLSNIKREYINKINRCIELAKKVEKEERDGEER